MDQNHQNSDHPQNSQGNSERVRVFDDKSFNPKSRQNTLVSSWITQEPEIATKNKRSTNELTHEEKTPFNKAQINEKKQIIANQEKDTKEPTLDELMKNFQQEEEHPTRKIVQIGTNCLSRSQTIRDSNILPPTEGISAVKAKNTLDDNQKVEDKGGNDSLDLINSVPKKPHQEQVESCLVFCEKNHLRQCPKNEQPQQAPLIQSKSVERTKIKIIEKPIQVTEKPKKDSSVRAVPRQTVDEAQAKKSKPLQQPKKEINTPKINSEMPLRMQVENPDKQLVTGWSFEEKPSMQVYPVQNFKSKIMEKNTSIPSTFMSGLYVDNPNSVPKSKALENKNFDQDIKRSLKESNALHIKKDVDNFKFMIENLHCGLDDASNHIDRDRNVLIGSIPMKNVQKVNYNLAEEFGVPTNNKKKSAYK